MASTKTGPSNVLTGLARARKGVGLGGRSEHKPRPPRRYSNRVITLTLLVFPSVFLVVLIYGYPAVGAVADSLCRLIEHTPDMTRIPLTLIEQHVDAEFQQANWSNRVRSVPVPRLLTRFAPERTE